MCLAFRGISGYTGFENKLKGKFREKKEIEKDFRVCTQRGKV